MIYTDSVHIVSDGEYPDELYVFAFRIGCDELGYDRERDWWTISPTEYATALKKGALKVTPRELRYLQKKKRMGLNL